VFDKGNNSQENLSEVLSKMHLIASAKHNEAKDLLDVPLDKYELLYTNRKEHKIFGYKTRHEFYDKEFTTVISYNEASYTRQKSKYEEDKKKTQEKLADLQKRLLSVKGRKRSISSIEREINDIIRKDLRSVIEYHLDGSILSYKVKDEVESSRKKGFGKTIIFTDLDEWDTKKIVKTYSNKYLVEEDFKMLNNPLQIPIGPVNHQKDHNIRVHMTLCVFGMLLHRYLYWKLRNHKLSPKQILAELEGIRVAMVQDKKTKKCQTQTETMNKIQIQLCTDLKLGDQLLK
jgi:transposase